MKDRPLVSVIVIFFNAEEFIQEAVESIFSQTYDGWELLLVDDGSTDRSTEIANDYVSCYPGKVSYLEHPGHKNLGGSASRNLGLRHTRGDYIAFLDADDVWHAPKLEQQIAIMESQPEVGILYGLTEYWYSWAGKPENGQVDDIPELGVPYNTPLRPPSLLIPFFLNQNAAIPSMSNIMIQPEVLELTGGFEETFRRIYTDQAFYAKACLVTAMYASPECWDRYRQHPDSSCSIVERDGQAIRSRLFSLNWLVPYLRSQGSGSKEIRWLLRREILKHRFPFLLSLSRNRPRIVRLSYDLFGRIASRVLPRHTRQKLSAYWNTHDGAQS